MQQPTSYENRMEGNPKAAARLVTPRTGYNFDDDDGPIHRGVAVRADHPCVASHRGAFTLATEGCTPHPSVAARAPKAPPKALKADED